jgi:hypothetical protein
MKPAISINKFLKVIVVTQRAKQILKGARTTSQTSATRLGGQGACFFPIHRCVSLDPKMACHCSIIGMNGIT